MTLPGADTLLEWFQTHQDLLGWAGLLSLVLFVGTLAAVPALIVTLPRRYLHEGSGANPFQGTPWHWPVLVAKNIVGSLLIVAGLAMLVLPGQGLLTICIGLVLMNFPGKKSLLRRLLGNPRVFRMVNRIRTRAGREPLEDPGERPWER